MRPKATVFSAIIFDIVGIFGMNLIYGEWSKPVLSFFFRGTMWDTHPEYHNYFGAQSAVPESEIGFFPTLGVPWNHPFVLNNQLFFYTGMVNVQWIRGMCHGQVAWENYPIGSMVLLYIAIYGSHQYTPFMLAYIPYIWVNYNISLRWIKAIWGWFPLLTMISSEVAVRSWWNLPR